MLIIDFKDLKYFIGCNQGNDYYYNTISGEILRLESIVSKLSISNQEFSENYFYYDYIPLPELNIMAAYEGFISSLNNKKISDHFKKVDKTDVMKFWLEFDRVFHYGYERRLWNEYYDDYVSEKAVAWCKEYGVRME